MLSIIVIDDRYENKLQMIVNLSSSSGGGKQCRNSATKTSNIDYILMLYKFYR